MGIRRHRGRLELAVRLEGRCQLLAVIGFGPTADMADAFLVGTALAIACVGVVQGCLAGLAFDL